MERHSRLTFSDFVFRLEACAIQYQTMMFANSMLLEHLLDPKLKEVLYSKNYELQPMDEITTNTMFINGESVHRLVEDRAKHTNTTYQTACYNLGKQNFHFIRTKALNALYELIMNYVEGLKFEKQKPLKNKLFKESWFKMLLLLRNNASHYDNYGKYMNAVWPFQAENQIVWETLIVRKEEIGQEIVYRDKQVLELLLYAINYFAANRVDFDVK